MTAPDPRRKEVVFVRADLVLGWLKQLTQYHVDAGRPAHADGVRGAANKIQREITKSNKTMSPT
jgi:hypothetical protein